MSFLTRYLPFLFEEDPGATAARYAPERMALATRDEKQQLIAHRATPANALVSFASDPDADIRILLAQRLSHLLPKVKKDDKDLAQLLLDAIRQLTEDSMTPVRVALASALKDVANIPPAIARKLADDAERSVAEPIIRYSLGLSDEDLLDLITHHPKDWHVLSIAQRRRLSEAVSDTLFKLENIEASRMLLANDTAKISANALALAGKIPDFEESLQKRNSLMRRLKRDIDQLNERALYIFLRNDAHLDKRTTKDVMDKIHARVDVQSDLAKTPPGDLSEEQLKNIIVLGENEIVIRALAAHAKIGEDIARRMAVESGMAKPIIALCVKAGFSMNFALLCQKYLGRLSPDKMIYPKDGIECPLTQDEIKWQWDFFGI